ncbi:phenazine biosynthesis protein PhzF family [Rippkaea orientalis PCC 8801]|uniref:Phenazine biosynthesis protein PhzF family n=1 Tax=Rippkaea orientalis (strain PCC 8801 / RF-1) TaxID=41431 RepID=B7K668_RIPO1|nr:PhzF family phenazine biosynthesis protein [Rippkaea orientalis]ACK68121.1 phenazine biosynthesis protein PhzF family [Rippkaea orientalis PCC 8801]
MNLTQQYKFYTLDVFTDQIFGGNPLAVFPKAQGLTDEQMQKVAAEFNLSETVFVLPPETSKGTRKLRIFTPKVELPFAGHPTVGTAYLLSYLGEIDQPEEPDTDLSIIFEEGVGLVPVTIKIKQGKPVYTELQAAQLPEVKNDAPSIQELAEILGLEITDFREDQYSPQGVSCGVPFLLIPLQNRTALGRINFNRDRWQHILGKAWASAMYVFCDDPETEGTHLRSRMFAPAMGITEDPATGSAATAFGAYLALRHPLTEGTLQWRIEQGLEMGRPSILEVAVEKHQGEIREIRVGGSSVLVSEGTMTIPLVR